MFNGKRNSHRTKKPKEIIKIPNGMPTIIDEETFAKVKERMLNNNRNASNKAKETYLLSGKIFCSCCGSSMVGHTSYSVRNKTKYSTYNCSKRYRVKGCKMKNISRDLVEEIALNEIKTKILNPLSIKSLTEKVLDSYKKTMNNNTTNLKSLEKHLNEIQFEIDNIVKAISQGMFHASFKEKMDNLEIEKNKISNYIAELKASMSNNDINEKLIEQYLLKDIPAINNKSVNDLKAIINTYVESILVHENKVELNVILLFVHIIGGGEARWVKPTKYLVSYLTMY